MLEVTEEVAAVSQPNTRSNVEVAKPSKFNRTADKVSEFLIVCKLFIKIKIREITVEEQIQWVLLYIERGSPDI